MKLNAQADAAPTEDAGTIENRLTLNPEEFPVIQEWEDGQEYALTDLPEGTKLVQISPGEFEVVAPVAAAGEAAGEEEEVEGEEGEEGEVAPAAPRRNPAVKNLIRAKYRA